MDYFGGRTDDQGNLLSEAYVPDPHLYFGDFSVGAGLQLQRQSITLSGIEDYFAIIHLTAVYSGAFRVKIYFATNGASLSTGIPSGNTDRVRVECIYGTAQRPSFLPAPVIIPGNSTIYQDFEDVANNGTNNIHTVFTGLRLNRKQ